MEPAITDLICAIERFVVFRLGIEYDANTHTEVFTGKSSPLYSEAGDKLADAIREFAAVVRQETIRELQTIMFDAGK